MKPFNCRALALGGGLALAAAASASAPVATALVIGQASTVSPPLAAAQQAWCKKASDVTKGRVSCAAAPVRLERGAEFESLLAGAVDLASISHEGQPERFPLSRVAELPFLGDFAETVSVAYQRTYEQTPQMADEHKGVKVLAVFTNTPGYLFTTGERLTRLAQLNGVGTAVSELSAEATGQALHAKAAPIAGMTTDNDRPLIGAALTRALDATLLEQHRTLRSATMFPGGLFNTSYAFAMNQKKWAALSPEDQRALEAISGTKAAADFGRAFDRAEWKANMQQRASGVVFYPPGESLLLQTRAALRAVDAAWVARAKRAGLKNAGRALADFRQEAARQEVAE